MGRESKGEKEKIMDEVVTPEPPQRMYPLEAPLEEQVEARKKHGIDKKEDEKS